MRFRALLFFAISLTALTSFSREGGTTAGDGGHMVRCFHYYTHPNRYSYELLDLHEARRSFPNDFFILQPPNLSRKTISYADAQLHYSRAVKNLRNALGEDHELVALVDSPIENSLQPEFITELISDYGRLGVELAPHCKIWQLAIRFESGSSEVIYGDAAFAAWLPAEDLAGLILHERLHKYFNSSPSTRAVRQTVMYAFALNRFRARNLEIFRHLVKTRHPLPNGLFL